VSMQHKIDLLSEQITEQMTGMGKPSSSEYYTANLRYGDLVISVSMPKSEAIAKGHEGIDVVVAKLATWILSITNPQK
jgi:hypothetical protein